MKEHPSVITIAELWRKIGFGFFAAGAVLGGALSTAGISYGQALKEQIVGTGQLVSLYVEENGAKGDSFGEHPLGLLMFDRSGNVIHILSKPGLPKVATGNRLTGTDAENRAIIQGMVAGFGTYTVDGDDTLTISWVASSFPNRVGTKEKRKLKMSGDTMVYTDPVPSSGGIAYSSYARAK